MRLLRLTLVLTFALTATASAAPGDLDGGFAGTGWTRTLVVESAGTTFLPAGAQAVAVQPDGAIVTAGTVIDATSNRYFGVARHRPDGALDPAFGSGGFAIVDVGSPEEARAVALQPDGRIVVAGETSCTTSRCITALRLNPDGTPDPTFGAGGVVKREFRQQGSWANAVAVDPDGRVVAGDGRDTAAGSRFGVARFRRDGRLDRSFGRRGHRLVAFGRHRHAGAEAIAALPGGGLAVAGSATVEDGAPKAAVARLTRNGRLDGRFGGDGRVVTSPGPFGGNGNAIAARPGGGVVVAGTAYVGAVFGDSDWRLLAYSRRGRLERAFGADFGTGEDEAAAVAVTPAGIVAAGSIGASLGVARFLGA